MLSGLFVLFMLGASIATSLRVENPLSSQTLFGVWLGLFMWGGLWLRDASLRAVFPFRETRDAREG